MARNNIDNGLHSLFYFSVILLGSVSSSKATVITAQTLVEFRNAGWTIVGSSPVTYARPGTWKAALRPLDETVTGGSVWRVTSSSDTIFRFDAFVSELCATNMKVEVTYFMEHTLVSVYPMKNPAGTGSEYFNLKIPTGIQWVTETIDIMPGNMIELKINVIPGSVGYIFFDQISIHHDAMECDPAITTDTTRTTDDASEWTETELPPTTELSTTKDPLTTTTKPECPTTPPPELCSCCDRCPERTREIHHHHYYPFSK